MKKVFVCILLLAICLCGCQSQNHDTSSTVTQQATKSDTDPVSRGDTTTSTSGSSSEDEREQTMSSNSTSSNLSSYVDAFGEFTGNINDLIDNNTPYHKKITKKYPEKDIINDDLLWTSRTSPFTSYALFFGHLILDYPAECIRQTDSTLYCLYETEENGLLYVYFNEAWEKPGNPSVRHTIYVKKKLQKKDFDSVKAGTKIKQVEAIDPVTTVYFSKHSDPKQTDMVSSLHLLTDGVMMIGYKYDQKANSWVVDQIMYSADFKLTIGDLTLDYSILTQDYVNS